MNEDKQLNPEFSEKLAALEHEQWAHWARHMLEVLGPLLDYGKAMTTGLAKQGAGIDHDGFDAIVAIVDWNRQIDTPYIDLPENEKGSHREWADRVLRLIHLNDDGSLNAK